MPLSTGLSVSVLGGRAGRDADERGDRAAGLGLGVIGVPTDGRAGSCSGD